MTSTVTAPAPDATATAAAFFLETDAFDPTFNGFRPYLVSLFNGESTGARFQNPVGSGQSQGFTLDTATCQLKVSGGNLDQTPAFTSNTEPVRFESLATATSRGTYQALICNVVNGFLQCHLPGETDPSAQRVHSACPGGFSTDVWFDVTLPGRIPGGCKTFDLSVKDF